MTSTLVGGRGVKDKQTAQGRLRLWRKREEGQKVIKIADVLYGSPKGEFRGESRNKSSLTALSLTNRACFEFFVPL